MKYCPYCNNAQSLLMGNIYCSHQGKSMENLDNGVMFIKSSSWRKRTTIFQGCPSGVFQEASNIIKPVLRSIDLALHLCRPIISRELSKNFLAILRMIIM